MAIIIPPTLAIVNDGTGTSVTATIGTTGYLTKSHQLFYCLPNAAGLTIGVSRTGPGTVVQTGLTENKKYWFQAAINPVSEVYSIPSNIVACRVHKTRTPVLELIAQEVLSQLEEVVAAGYAASVKRPEHYRLPESPGHLALYLYQLDPEDSDESENLSEYWWWQPFVIDGYVRRTDKATDAVDPIINELRANIEQELMSDVRLNSRAIRSEIRPAESFAHGPMYEGVRVNFWVLYATPDDDPFTNAVS